MRWGDVKWVQNISFARSKSCGDLSHNDVNILNVTECTLQDASEGTHYVMYLLPELKKEEKRMKVKVKVAQLCPTLQPHGIYSPWNSPGQNPGVGSLSLLQGIFPTQGLNPGLPHRRPILYQLSHKGKGNRQIIFNLYTIFNLYI